LVKDNIYIKNFAKIPYFFTETIGMGAGREGPCYRPLQMLTYMFDYSVWKLNVFGYHLTNILLHIFAALAIFWFINILYGSQFLAFLTSILFIVHPVHTEAVAYISGRADSLATIFILMSLIYYIKQGSQKKTTTFILMVLSSLAAMLSKEYSLIIPILLLIYSYIFLKKILAREFISIVIVDFIYIVVRCMVVKSVPLNIAHTSTLFQRVPGFFVAITEYLRLMLLPLNLHMEYGNRLVSFSNFESILGIVILLALSVYAFKKRHSDNLISFSIFWFFIVLLPVSNLYPINAYIAEHWLYLPSLGFFLIFAHGLIMLYKIKKARLITIFLIIFILTTYSYLTVKQNSYWREPVAFYKKTIYYSPHSPRLYRNLGKAYLEHGNYQEAIKTFQKAIDIDSKNAGLYNILGTTYSATGDIENAIIFYQKAISINPRYADAYYHLGNAYNSMGDTEKAISSYKKAIEIAPNNVHVVSYYNNLAYIYALNGKIDEAMALYERALEIDPNSLTLKNNIKALYNIMHGNKK
ncbi:MAG: tetratricopeptide repeat protein, partial [Candidatus Omnitrophica bacterium]|nr:tetratricopeptide repeat protein [Candidatus Omnitrophota bacterium]